MADPHQGDSLWHCNPFLLDQVGQQTPPPLQFWLLLPLLQVHLLQPVLPEQVLFPFPEQPLQLILQPRPRQVLPELPEYHRTGCLKPL